MIKTRIVVFGQPLAGKCTILEMASKSQGNRLRSATHPSDPHHHSVVYGAFSTDRVQAELATVPGGVLGTDVWAHVLRDSTGVLLVLDPQRTVSEMWASVDHLEALWPREKPVCLVMSKADVVPADVLSEKRRLVLDELRQRDIAWSAFVTRKDQSDTVLRPLLHLLDEVARRASGA